MEKREEARKTADDNKIEITIAARGRTRIVDGIETYRDEETEELCEILDAIVRDHIILLYGAENLGKLEVTAID